MHGIAARESSPGTHVAAHAAPARPGETNVAIGRSAAVSILAAIAKTAGGPADGPGHADHWEDQDLLTRLAAAALAALMAAPAAAAPLCDEFGFAGLLAKCNRGEPVALTLSSGKPLHEGDGPVMLQSGAYYVLEITADGTAELAVSGPDFFRAIWINEIVINDIEIRPMAVDSLEFDAAGSASISFIAIKPGAHTLSIPGSSGEAQSVTFQIQ